MTVCALIFMPFIDLRLYKHLCFSDFSYNLGLIQLFLINLQNMANFDVLARKTEEHQLTKIVLQVVLIHVSNVLCC